MHLSERRAVLYMVSINGRIIHDTKICLTSIAYDQHDSGDGGTDKQFRYSELVNTRGLAMAIVRYIGRLT